MSFSELHLHLDGSLSLPDVRFLAPLAGVSLPTSDDELRSLLVAPARAGSLKEYLKSFEIPLRVLVTPESLKYATESLVCRLAKIGVEYAEIRFAPGLHTAKGASQKEILEGALAGFRIGANRCGMGGGLILCCMRGGALTEKENLLTANLCAEYKGKGVVGIDLAGDEAKDSPADYGYVFGAAREAGVNITVHAGEAGGPDKIRAAIKEGATRIGHGVRATEDESLIAELKERGTTLELCYTSNLSTGASTPQTFPLRYLVSAGVRVTLNSDNMTVSDTDIQKEVSRLKLTEQELNLINRYAEEARFA